MSSEKYIGLDVHQATISVAVMDSQGKVVMESILETKASTILEFLAGLRAPLHLAITRIILLRDEAVDTTIKRVPNVAGMPAVAVIPSSGFPD